MSLKTTQNISFCTDCITSILSSTRGSSFSRYTQTKKLRKKKTRNTLNFVSRDQRLLLKRSLQYRIQHTGGWDMGQANEEQNPCAQNLKQMNQLSNYGTHQSKTII